MNDKRRKSLRGAYELLREASELVEAARDEEEECLANIPENLIGSERCERIEAAFDLLDNSVDSLEDAMGCIEEALM